MPETAEPTAVDNVAETTSTLRTWGLSGEPVAWANTTWQPAIASIRAANRGEMDAAAVQAVLDATFEPGEITAGDVVLAHTPTATFTFGPGDGEDGSFDFALDGDADLDLPPDNVTWEFGDNTFARGYPVTHTYTKAGAHDARCEVAFGGSVVATTQLVEALGGGVPVITDIDPTSRVVGPTADVVLHVNGEKFEPGSLIRFADVVEQATGFVSSSQLTLEISGELFTGPDTVDVAVVTGNLESNTVPFEFTAVEPEPDPEPEADEAKYDPADDNIPDVVAYVTDNPDDRTRVIRAERRGKNRTTLIDQLKALKKK